MTSCSHSREGPAWTTAELEAEFDVIAFAAPYVEVVRKSDGVRGTMQFARSPRVYFAFRPSAGPVER